MEAILIEEVKVRKVQPDPVIHFATLEEDGFGRAKQNTEAIRMEHFRWPEKGIDVMLGFTRQAEENLRMPMSELMGLARRESERADRLKLMVDGYEIRHAEFWSQPWYRRLWRALRKDL